MPLICGRSVGILGTGSYAPDKIVTNFDLEKMLETTNQWIVERTGIESRHVAEPGQNTSDLGAEAARRALADAGVAPEQIGLILLGSNSPDNTFPASSARVQHAIGAVNAGVSDLQSGCSSSVYGMSLAAGAIASGIVDYALVIGAEVMSRILDWTDRSTCILFGDGAGAVVMGPARDDVRRVISADMKADGSKADYIIMPAGGVAMPASEETVRDRKHFVSMNGSDVFKFANRELPGFLESFCAASQISPVDVDWWVFHQANKRIIDGILKRFGVSSDKAIVNLDRYGNTSSASVMIALDEAIRDGRIRPGERVVVTGFGAGMTYGSVLFTA